MTEDRAAIEELSARLTRMEAVQMQNLRRSMFLLVYFTVAFACLAWEWLKRFNLSLESLPVATVLVICVWVFCVARHARKLVILRKVSLLVHGTHAVSAESSTSGEQPAAHGQEPATGV